MRTRELKRTLAEANPVGADGLPGLDWEAAEADLLEDLVGEATPPTAPAPAARGLRARPGRFALAVAGAALAAAAAVLVVVGGSSERTSPAYGADLVRFAESTPLLLLEGPGWRVQNVNEYGSGEGSMEFVTGKPIPYESIRISGSNRRQHESGMFPAAVRQRRVELRWFHGDLGQWVSSARRMPHPHGQGWTELPVLDTTARVDSRAEFYVNQGGPGNRLMKAFWSEGGYVLELVAAVPDLAAFEERLRWLNRVDSEAWLDAMPAKVVKAADHDTAVEEMLQGISQPPGFDPSRIPDNGLTTSRYQVGAAVGGSVACAWFRRWGEAVRDGEAGVAKQAEVVLQGAGSWPIFREMSKDGAYPEVVVAYAKAMPSRRWYGRPLLPDAGQGLGCKTLGVPLGSG